jgi:hypothetical protein
MLNKHCLSMTKTPSPTHTAYVGIIRPKLPYPCIHGRLWRMFVRSSKCMFVTVVSRSQPDGPAVVASRTTELFDDSHSRMPYGIVTRDVR